MNKLTAYQIFVGLFISNTLFAADTQTIDVTMNQPKFIVMLPANPTTGYQWTIISYDKSHIGFINSVYQTPTKQQLGTGGKMIFTFVARPSHTYPVSSKIKLKYARPWDSNRGTFTDVIVTINANTTQPTPSTKSQ